MSLVARTSLFYTNFIVSLFVKTVILINSGFFYKKSFVLKPNKINTFKNNLKIIVNKL